MAEPDYAAAGLGADPKLAAALAEAFDAVMSPDRWPDVMERLAEAMQAEGLWFQSYRAGADEISRAPMSQRYRDILAEYVPDGWLAQDLRATRGWALAEKGWRIVTENDVTTPEERARLPIYTDLFRRYEVEDWAGVSLSPAGERWGFTIIRSARMAEKKDTQATDPARLALVRPYLTRLLSFSRAMADAASAGAMTALERSATPAVILDWSGRVKAVSDRAQGLLGQGLVIRGGRLAADDREAQAVLEARIAAAVSSQGSQLGVDRTPLPIPTPRGGVVLAEVTPLRGAVADSFGHLGALVTLIDPLRRRRPSPIVLRRLFGLTQREAEAAVLIAGGDSVPEMAEAMGLRASSVRQIIKALMWKTGARRQAELTALFAGLPGAD